VDFVTVLDHVHRDVGQPGDALGRRRRLEAVRQAEVLGLGRAEQDLERRQSPVALEHDEPVLAVVVGDQRLVLEEVVVVERADQLVEDPVLLQILQEGDLVGAVQLLG
jgi:hypothetical protein